MAPRFADVEVAPHPALPEGFSGRWMCAGDSTEVTEIYYTPDQGPDGVYQVTAQWCDGRRSPAVQVPVEDSAAGVSQLLIGGDYGLRLWREGGPEWAESYLLLAE